MHKPSHQIVLLKLKLLVFSMAFVDQNCQIVHICAEIVPSESVSFIFSQSHRVFYRRYMSSTTDRSSRYIEEFHQALPLPMILIKNNTCTLHYQTYMTSSRSNCLTLSLVSHECLTLLYKEKQFRSEFYEIMETNNQQLQPF